MMDWGRSPWRSGLGGGLLLEVLGLGTQEMDRERPLPNRCQMRREWAGGYLSPGNPVIQDGQPGTQLLLRRCLRAAVAPRCRGRCLRGRADREHRNARRVRIGARAGRRVVDGPPSSAVVSGRVGGPGGCPPARPQGSLDRSRQDVVRSISYGHRRWMARGALIGSRPLGPDRAGLGERHRGDDPDRGLSRALAVRYPRGDHPDRAQGG